MKITREQFSELQALPFFKSKVITNSMEPVIMVGDEIIIDVGNPNIKRFDIIVFYSDEKLICHLLWRKNKIVKPVLLQTRNMRGGMDLPIAHENYLGKVINFRLSLWQKLRMLFK
jgi:signal peptidase I